MKMKIPDSGAKALHDETEAYFKEETSQPLLMAYVAGLESEVQQWKGIAQDWCQQSHDNKAAYDKLFAEWEAANDWQRERVQLEAKVERLQRLESYVCGVIAMGTQADLRVENLP
jgi:hypothetical protein